MYFVSTYIKCEYCQTQNTFIPSMKMSLLPDLIREIANSEIGIIAYSLSGNTLLDQFILVEDQVRKHYFIKKHYLPQLEKSYLAIYKRELSDFMLGHNFSEEQSKQSIN